jgi:hypothetical protein
MCNDDYDIARSEYHNYILCFLLYCMNIENQSNRQDKNDLIPSDTIAYAARFNKQFLNKELASPVTVNIGKMLTVMGQQENTIGILCNIMGQNYSDKQLHDMHNSIFGSLADDGSVMDSKGMDLEGILDKLTACIHQQNQQIKELLEKISQNTQHDSNN